MIHYSTTTRIILVFRRLTESERFRVRVHRADAADDAAAFKTLQSTHRIAATREAGLRAARAASKAKFDEVMTQQMDDMTRLTAAWQEGRAEVAAAEAELESARVARVKAERDHADYFRSQRKQCVAMRSVARG